MSRLVTKLLAVHESLERAQLPHAFGGAIALAYCTHEPRGTRDLDVNIFAPAEGAASVLRKLPSGVAVGDGDIEAVVRDGQTRLWWDDTPIDVFLNNMDFHGKVADRVEWVELTGRKIPVLDCASLTVFKAYFDRGKDWVDIEGMAERDAAVVECAAAMVGALSGADDARRGRLLRIADRHQTRLR